MKDQQATVARIRPVSWKICVPGEDCANYVRSVLYALGIDCSDPVREPELQKSPMFSFIATPKIETPLTASELQAILDQDSKIDIAFEA
jgi:hypothetical protein